MFQTPREVIIGGRGNTKRIVIGGKQPVTIQTMWKEGITDITKGSDALSLINTITGMKIDIYRRKFVLANKTGGMSGPAIKPVAVRMVYQVHKACSLPIIGMGGIMTGEDAIEMMMAGATMVSVGTANFHNPRATMDVLDGIKAYMETCNIHDINEKIGCME